MSPRILVFDSGVGGLSVLSEIRQALPLADFVYVADSGFYPYGTKSEAELCERVPAVIDKISAEFSPDLCVIACNSASTAALDVVRQRLSIPIVGTVPAIKPAAQHSRTKVIGLLATPGTVARDYTDDLIATFASACTILRHGTATLVDLAERKIRGDVIELGDVHAATQDLFGQSEGHLIDTVVLACTHFPLLIDELREAWPDRSITWIDSGEAIARRVVDLLTQAPVSEHAEPFADIAVVTRATSKTSELELGVRQFGFTTLVVREIS